MKKVKVKKYSRALPREIGSMKFLEERDWLHPKNLEKIPGAVCRYGQCKTEAEKFSKHHKKFKVYVRGNQHAIAFDGDLVYDYVLDPVSLIHHSTYFNNVDGVFEKVG